MANKFYFESRDERIERMNRDNPGRAIELCTVVVDGIWDKRRQLIESRIPERFSEASIADLGYLTDPILDSVEEMLAPQGKNDTVGVIFCGPTGSGKTHAAYAVLRMLAEKNPESIAFMTTYSGAFNTLKSEFASNSNTDMGSVWDRLNNDSGMYDGVIFIDDVSSQKPTDFEIDKLMMIIDKRVNSYMPFILTTNVKPKDFKQVFGERLASRLFGFCEVIEFEARDKRIRDDEGGLEDNEEIA